MGSATARAPRRAPRAPRQGAPRHLVLTAAFIALAVALTALATLPAATLLPMGLAAGVAGLVLLIALLGAERVGILALMGAMGTAPFYKGLVPADVQATPTDGLFVLGFALLLPRLLRGRLRLPLPYTIGVSGLAICGLISSAASADPLTSLISLVLWMAVMAGLPIALRLLEPSSNLIDLLAWSYVGGHLANSAYAVVKGPVIDGRYQGLAFHPNFFAEAGLMSGALLLYLFHRRSDWRYRVLVLGAGAVCAASIMFSGSRAATVVAAVLVLMIPIVERSAVMGFFYALLGALALAFLPLAISLSGPDSSLARLAGSGSSSGSDTERLDGLEKGVERFLDHPVIGSGFLELFDIHNNLLEVAVAVGVLGLAAYFGVLYAFCRPLFGTGTYRRLCYTGWAAIGFGATIPSLYDRSIWAAMALSAVAFIIRDEQRAPELHEAGPGEPGATDSERAPTAAPTAAVRAPR